MDRQLERCCGLDVHKETIAACVRISGQRGHAVQHVQTFRTTAAELVVLRDWLAANGVTHVAMESAGVYWKPVFYALESDFTCLLVNAAHIKQVPGRKTDVQDCVWIAQLLEHGLLRGSFVPRGMPTQRAAWKVLRAVGQGIERGGARSIFPSPAIFGAVRRQWNGKNGRARTALERSRRTTPSFSAAGFSVISIVVGLVF